MAGNCQDCGVALKSSHNPIRCKPCNGKHMRKNPEKHKNFCACGKLKSHDAKQCKECAQPRRPEPHGTGNWCDGCGKKIIFVGRCYECATHRPRLLVRV